MLGMHPLRTPAWLVKHAVAVVLVITFLGLGWWQIRRAADGNMLSYGYALEWPLFAAFVVLLWWREVRHTLRRPPQEDVVKDDAWDTPVVLKRTAPNRPMALTAPEEDSPELREYNHMLARLHAQDSANPANSEGAAR